MRRAAKAVNFGVIYGQSPFGLAKQLGIDQAEAARFINAYFDRYRGVEEFLLGILERGTATVMLVRPRATAHDQWHPQRGSSPLSPTYGFSGQQCRFGSVEFGVVKSGRPNSTVPAG